MTVKIAYMYENRLFGSLLLRYNKSVITYNIIILLKLTVIIEQLTIYMYVGE